MAPPAPLRPPWALLLLSIGSMASAGPVIGWVGQPVTLPCRYAARTPSEANPVCWGRGACPMSQCSDTLIQTDKTRVTWRKSDRYQIQGALTRGDVSLTILDAKEGDSGTYCCRIDVPGWFNDLKYNIELQVRRVPTTIATTTTSTATTTTTTTTTASTTTTMMPTTAEPTTVEFATPTTMQRATGSVTTITDAVIPAMAPTTTTTQTTKAEMTHRTTFAMEITTLSAAVTIPITTPTIVLPTTATAIPEPTPTTAPNTEPLTTPIATSAPTSTTTREPTRPLTAITIPRILSTAIKTPPLTTAPMATPIATKTIATASVPPTTAEFTTPPPAAYITPPSSTNAPTLTTVSSAPTSTATPINTPTAVPSADSITRHSIPTPVLTITSNAPRTADKTTFTPASAPRTTALPPHRHSSTPPITDMSVSSVTSSFNAMEEARTMNPAGHLPPTEMTGTLLSADTEIPTAPIGGLWTAVTSIITTDGPVSRDEHSGSGDQVEIESSPLSSTSLIFVVCGTVVFFILVLLLGLRFKSNIWNKYHLKEDERFWANGRPVELINRTLHDGDASIYTL